MQTQAAKNGYLSNNALKLIAAALMLCDHAGMLLFPKILVLRLVGRLSFPIFAYLIAEGAKHTKSYLRYFLTVAGFAAVIQVGYYAFSRSLEMSVLVTFTLSLAIIFVLELFKRALFTAPYSAWRIAATAALLSATILLSALLDSKIDLDYHFSGCLLPVFPSLFTTPRVADPPAIFKRLDAKLPRILIFSLGMLLLTFDIGILQLFGFFAIPLLLLYSGQRGKLKMKYFFYVFYPLHLIILYAISMLIG